EPQPQQAVREQRSEDRRLGEEGLAGRGGEEDDEQLRQIAERGLEGTGDSGAEALADRLGRDPDQPGEAAERGGGEHEDRSRGDARVMEDTRDRRENAYARDE